MAPAHAAVVGTESAPRPSLPDFSRQPAPPASCDRGVLQGRAPHWLGCRTIRDWPEAGRPPPPSSSSPRPREGGESRDFREPVRKDINKTNPRQHGEGPWPLQRNRPQPLSRPTPTGERRCPQPGARRGLGWRTSRAGGGGGPLA